MRRTLPLLAAVILSSGTAHACSCFGNSSYCETLAPGWFLNPDATALVVKLTDYHYGITVKVLQTFGGTSLPNDTLRVWGDNGGLCRPYLSGMAIGDTMVFGMNVTDFMGNSVWNPDYPPDLEEEGDYMVSVCGVHIMDYANGMVSGPITAEGEQHLTLAEFNEAIVGCSLGTGVEERERDPLVVRYLNGSPQLELPGCTGQVELRVTDAQGRVVVSRAWNGLPLQIDGPATGVYIAEVRMGKERWLRKLIVG